MNLEKPTAQLIDYNMALTILTPNLLENKGEYTFGKPPSSKYCV